MRHTFTINLGPHNISKALLQALLQAVKQTQRYRQGTDTAAHAWPPGHMQKEYTLRLAPSPSGTSAANR